MKTVHAKGNSALGLLAIIIALGLFGYLVYASNVFFLSKTERLIKEKVTTMEAVR